MHVPQGVRRNDPRTQPPHVGVKPAGPSAGAGELGRGRPRSAAHAAPSGERPRGPPTGQGTDEPAPQDVGLAASGCHALMEATAGRTPEVSLLERRKDSAWPDSVAVQLPEPGVRGDSGLVLARGWEGPG